MQKRKIHLNSLHHVVQNVQTFFEASADLQFEDAKNACEIKAPNWIKFENAMSSTFEIVSALCNECLGNIDKSLIADDVSLVSQMLQSGFKWLQRDKKGLKCSKLTHLFLMVLHGPKWLNIFPFF